MGLGKKRKVLQKSVFRSFDISYVEQHGGLTEDHDYVRVHSDNLWSSIGSDLVYGDFSHGLEDSVAFQALQERGITAELSICNIKYEELVPETDEQFKNTPFPVLSQIIELNPKPRAALLYDTSAKFQPDQWAGLTKNIKDKVLSTREVRGTTYYVDNPFEKTFQDCVFDYESPYDDADLSSRGPLIEPLVKLVGDIDPEYNFFVNNYEDFISRPRISERVLPCMYTFISEKESDYTDRDNSIYNQHISLSNRIKGTFKDITNKRGERIGEKDIGISDYFTTWSNTAPELLRRRGRYNYLLKKYENLIFSQEDIDLLNAYAEKKESFPMAIDIRFSTGPGTQTTNVLKESKLTADFIGYALTSEPEFMEYINSDYVNSAFSSQTIDMAAWWGTIGEQRKMNNAVVFGRNKTNESGILNPGAGKGPIANLLKILFMGKIRNLINQNSRSLEEIFEEGKSAHSESILYEIEKYDNDSGQLVQRIYVPNSSELNVCNYIDTQVKYDKEYRYRIYVHQLVFGTEYSYSEEEPRSTQIYENGVLIDDVTGDGLLDLEKSPIEIPRFKVRSRPILKLIRLQYYDSPIIKIIDKPPVAPDVEFVSYRGIADRILLNINSGIGDYKLQGIIFKPREERRLRELERNQKVEPGGLINYVSDDSPQFFYIYRTTEKPASYSDFANTLRHRLDTRKGGQYLSSMSYVDQILPNVKYYYTFRSVDVHDHLSFPSPIYQVEMVEEDGAVYLLMNVFDFEQEVIKETSLPMENTIYISPNITHRRIDTTKTFKNIDGSIDSADAVPKEAISLGPSQGEGLWGKRFKFRFTSKNTGRKFDVNARFVYSINLEEDKVREKSSKRSSKAKVSSLASPASLVNPGLVDNEHYEPVLDPNGNRTTKQSDTSPYTEE